MAEIRAAAACHSVWYIATCHGRVLFELKQLQLKPKEKKRLEIRERIDGITVSTVYPIFCIHPTAPHQHHTGCSLWPEWSSSNEVGASDQPPAGSTHGWWYAGRVVWISFVICLLFHPGFPLCTPPLAPSPCPPTLPPSPLPCPPLT